MDKRVMIHGTTRADMNGRCGVATDFHPMDNKDHTTWRYTVKLDSGEVCMLRPGRLRAEQAGKELKHPTFHQTKMLERQAIVDSVMGSLSADIELCVSQMNVK